MTPLEIILYIILPIIIIFFLVFIIMKSKKKSIIIDFDLFLTVKKENIKSVDLIRNKIVLLVKDLNVIDMEQLKLSGASGITVVGDKIKFFVKDNETTQKVYDNIKGL